MIYYLRRPVRQAFGLTTLSAANARLIYSRRLLDFTLSGKVLLGPGMLSLLSPFYSDSDKIRMVMNKYSKPSDWRA